MDNTDPVDVLARTVWGEARGEGRAGMVAVANVAVNRAASPRWWGHDIISVCLQPWQFSCRNKNDPNAAKLAAVNDSDPYFNQALSISALACAGTLADTTNGATHYFVTKSTIPAWALALTPCAIIGRHSFYRAVA